MTKYNGGIISLNKCLPFNKIPDYIARLGRDFEVWFTIKSGKELVWTNDVTKIKDWQFGISHIPPKVFFFPGFETILNNSRENKLQIPHLNNRKKILFGVSPVDIKAITLFDKLMGCHFERSNGVEESLKRDSSAEFQEFTPIIASGSRNDNNTDFYYQRKKKQFYLIGMGDFEFADSVCDIFLESNGDVFDIYIKNHKAIRLVNYKGIFYKSVFEPERQKKEFDPLFYDLKKLSQAVEKSYKSKIWDDLAKICLGCGICSYVCPLCYCHEIFDNFELNNKNCSSCRVRRWNSCFAPDFFEVSGHNFRPQLRDRIYNWYHHKFVRMPAEVGHVGCVDCGRCIKYCPAKINFKNVLSSLM